MDHATQVHLIDRVFDMIDRRTTEMDPAEYHNPVSRYIDPCGLIVPLGCEPFLWHPLIATVLGWPAALVMLLLMVLFAGTARLIGGRSERKIRGRDLKRRGEK